MNAGRKRRADGSDATRAGQSSGSGSFECVANDERNRHRRPKRPKKSHSHDDHSVTTTPSTRNNRALGDRPQNKSMNHGYTKPSSNGQSQIMRSRGYSTTSNDKKKAPTPPPPQPTEKERALWKAQSELPIHPHTSAIRRALHQDRDVLLLVGETGSGKSTQVPQYLLSEPWCKRGIAITQPRRVAAISLARRVAEEMSSPLNSDPPSNSVKPSKPPPNLVGYSVRFDQKVAEDTRIKYLTEGMLLQELLRDQFLTEYSCVIVDEVHERSVNCDLILGFLRRIVTCRTHRIRRRDGHPLKVVVMSATADVEALYDFFAEGFKDKKIADSRIEIKDAEAVVSNPLTSGLALRERGTHDNHQSESMASGLAPRQQDMHRKHGKKQKKHKGKPDDSAALKAIASGTYVNSQPPTPISQNTPRKDSDVPEIIEAVSDHIATHYVKGRQHPVEVSYLAEPAQEYIEAALDTVMQIHRKEPLPGDILVFLTGQEMIESLENLLNEKAGELVEQRLPSLQSLPLFAALSPEAQQAIFSRAPAGSRRVILSTNIAETSVTIPGVRFVVDSGLSKVKEYRSSLGLDSLLVKPISQSAAIQRNGRAGREAPGKCYRLYTEKNYQALDAANTPEILMCDLASAILTMKSRGVANPLDFPLLTQPPAESLRRAFFHLLRLGALDEKGDLTLVGKQMARLPIAPPLARVIIAAADQDAKDSNDAASSRPAEIEPAKSLTLAVIDIIAALSVEKVFLPTTGATSEPIPSTLSGTTNTNTTTKPTDTDLAARIDLQKTLHSTTGDHLTLLSALRAYAAESPTARTRFCTHRHLNARALKTALQIRTQLRAQAVSSKLLHATTLARAQHLEKDGDVLPVAPQMAEEVLRCFLRGFQANVAVLRKSKNSGRSGSGGGGGGGGMGEYRTVEGGREVAIHPGSVLFGRKCEAICFQELVFTGRLWARGVSAVEVGWWGDVCGGA